jgi:hypothetical protein
MLGGNKDDNKKISLEGNNSEESSPIDPTSLLSPNDIDPIALANGWLDDGMRLYFSAGAIAYVLTAIKESLIPTNVANGFGAGWNYFDSIGGYVAAAEGIKKFSDGKVVRREHEKRAAIATNIGMSTLLTGATTLTLLSQYHVLSVAVAAALGTTATAAGTIGFAACMWASTAWAARKLQRSVKNLDTLCLLENITEKIKKINEKMAVIESVVVDEPFKTLFKKIRDKVEKTNKNLDFVSVIAQVIAKLDKRFNKYITKNTWETDGFYSADDARAEYEKLKEFLQNQVTQYDNLQKRKENLEEKAIALASVQYAKEGLHETEKSRLNAVFETWKEMEKAAPKLYNYGLNPGQQPKPTEAQKNLADEIKKNQQENVKRKSISLAVWTVAAIGMTFAAAGFWFPPLFLPGVIICSIAGGVKLGEVIYNQIVNRVAKKQLFDAEKEKYFKEHKGKDPTELKREIAYNLSNTIYQKQHPHQDLNKEKYFSALDNLKNHEPKKYEALLNAALDRHIEDRILKDILGDGCELLAISDKTKEQIINRQCRNDFSMSKCASEIGVFAQATASTAASHSISFVKGLTV